MRRKEIWRGKERVSEKDRERLERDKQRERDRKWKR